METKVEALQDNKVKVTVTVDAKEVDNRIKKAYKDFANKYNFPGFRKGKAPRAVVEGMYGAEVFYQDAIDELAPQAFESGLNESGLKIVGAPAISDVKVTDERTVEFTFAVTLYPEVTLGQYKGLEAEKDAVSVSDEQVDSEIDATRRRNARMLSVEDRAAEMGDTANIDFEGFDNGVPFEGGKGDNFDLKLGSGQFVPGFEEQIVGMSAGEEKDIDITFPEDYHKELAGKAVVFHVKLNKVTETIVPEQDDEFAKDVSEFDTLDELKADIRAKALENAKKQADSAFEQAAVDKAAENTTVDMPKALVENELDIQMERFGYQLQMSGYSMEQYAKMMGGDVSTMRNAFRPAAEKQAKISVTLEKIAEVEGITASDEDIEAEFKSLAEQYELEVDKVKEMVPMDELTGSIKTRKAIKVIVDSAVPVAPKAEEKTEE